MNDCNEIRKGRLGIYDIHVHLVFVTKYRRSVFTEEHLNRMGNIFRDVCASFDCRLEAFDGAADHVHLLVNIPPTVEVSHLVNSLKGVSSRYLRRDYPELTRHYWRNQRLWAGSYYAGTNPDTPTTLNQYLIQQHTTIR